MSKNWVCFLGKWRGLKEGHRVIAELIPDPVRKRYDIEIRSGVSENDLKAAESGTIGREGKYGEALLIHQVDGVNHKTKISTLRGDYRKPDGSIGNRLRQWGPKDFAPRSDDLYQERLYCIQWVASWKDKVRKQVFAKPLEGAFGSMQTASVVMGAAVPTMTAEDGCAMREDGFRYELVRGGFKRMPPAGCRHG
jgi:hypothetical protein